MRRRLSRGPSRAEVRRDLLVAFVLLLAAVPFPSAGATHVRDHPWSVDATVAVQDATTADYTWRISDLTNTRLKLPLPDGATFVEAKDVDGRALDADVEGDQIAVSIGSKAAILRFRLTATPETPFGIFSAQVASASDSPVTVGITLPAGFSLAGYRDNDDDAPDATGTFRKVGPAYVQFLVLPSGFADTGPDARVSGSSVRREATANVTSTGTTWTLTTTYDADVYSRDWDVHVPAGATLVRAWTAYGPLTPTTTSDGVKVRTPYPVGYGLGGRSFSVELRLAAPEGYGGAFQQANLSIRAADGDVVGIQANLPSDLRYAGARIAGNASAEVAPLRFEARGPLSVSLALMPPAGAGHVQFTEGSFVVDVASSREAIARATAKNATEMLPRAAPFVHDASDTRPFFVSYTDADIFSWEEGFYSNGMNTISIRASTLANATDAKAHLVPVSVLIHEATHGLIDRRLPDAPHDLSFLHEGLARLAETRTEMSFPDEIVVCRQEFLRQQCDRHSARPGAEEIQDRYRKGATFQLDWKAGDVSDAERGTLYDYSGFVLHAYTQRAPAGALENAILHVARTRFADDGSDAARITDILLANAPGTTAQALLYPSAEAASLSIEQFRFCIGTLAAPLYPWEEARAPNGGCPATGYGPRDASLPTPPAATDTTSTTNASTSEPPPPPPRISPPLTVVTPPDDGGATASNDNDPVPGAVVEDLDPSRPGSGTPQVVVPGPGALLAIIAIALVALRLRRR